MDLLEDHHCDDNDNDEEHNTRYKDVHKRVLQYTWGAPSNHERDRYCGQTGLVALVIECLHSNSILAIREYPNVLVLWIGNLSYGTTNTTLGQGVNVYLRKQRRYQSAH